MRPVGTLATFSIWKTLQALTNMVHGRSLTLTDRHVKAMQERDRKGFHYEF